MADQTDQERWRPYSTRDMGDPRPLTQEQLIRTFALDSAAKIMAARLSRGGWARVDSVDETLEIADVFAQYITGVPRDAES